MKQKCWSLLLLTFCEMVHVEAFYTRLYFKNMCVVIFIQSFFAEVLTETGLGSPSLTEVKKAGAHVAVPLEVGEEEEEEAEAEADLSCLQRSWTPSWMPTMPKYAFILHEIGFQSLKCPIIAVFISFQMDTS